jgi:hypothetical protein
MPLICSITSQCEKDRKEGRKKERKTKRAKEEGTKENHSVFFSTELDWTRFQPEIPSICHGAFGVFALLECYAA